MTTEYVQHSFRTVRFQNISNLGGDEMEGTVDGTDVHGSLLTESADGSKKLA